MTPPAVPGLTRHYVTLGGRQIHYRRMGRGPALLALHRLPRSSADLISFMRVASARFTVIAPDLAGYGNSWPLASPAPFVSDYAADLAAFLAALKVERCVVYGEQLGALAALALAAKEPKRVAAVAVDLPPACETEADLAAARGALKPFMPQWDGSHLAWLWAVLREENCFRPWWRKTLGARLYGDMPSADELQHRAVQFLTGHGHGRGYHVGLAAEIAADPVALRAQCPVPVAEASHGVPAAAIVDDLHRQAAGIEAPPPAPRPTAIAGRLWHDFVAVPGGQLHVQMNDDAGTLPLLIQHDAASSMGTVQPITASLIGKRTVMAFDMPGSGESDNTLGTDGLTDDAVEVEAYAATLRAALDALGLRQADFYGMWGGGFVGLDLALMDPTRIRRLIMSNLFQHDGEEQRLIQARYTPPIVPVWHGGHLMQAWHQMRDQGIYYPWFDATAKGVIRREPFLATDMVHERVCSLLKAGNMYRAAYQAHFRYRTYDRLKRSPVPTLIATTAWDPNNPHTQAAARAAPNAQFRYLDQDFMKWGLSFLDFLDAP